MEDTLKILNLPAPVGWFPLALQILPHLGNIKKGIGIRTSTELISSLAASMKITPRGLAKQLEAARFLQTTYPELVAQHGVDGGHSQVEFLQRIHKLAPQEADLIAADVVRGRVSMVQIRKKHQELLAKNPHAHTAAIQGRRRALEFDRTCFEAISNNLELLGIPPLATVVQKPRVKGAYLDAAVFDGTTILCGFEFVVGGVASAERNTLPILARVGLFKNITNIMWVFFPQWAAHMGEALIEDAQEWGVSGIKVALVLEDGKQTELKVLN